MPAMCPQPSLTTSVALAYVTVVTVAGKEQLTTILATPQSGLARDARSRAMHPRLGGGARSSVPARPSDNESDHGRTSGNATQVDHGALALHRHHRSPGH